MADERLAGSGAAASTDLQPSQMTDAPVGDATQAPRRHVHDGDEAMTASEGKTSEGETSEGETSEGVRHSDDGCDGNGSKGPGKLKGTKQSWSHGEDIILMEKKVDMPGATWAEVLIVYNAAVEGRFTPRGTSAPMQHYTKFKTSTAFTKALETAVANGKWIKDKTWTQAEDDQIKNLALRVKKVSGDSESQWPLLIEHYVVFLGAIAKLGSKHHTRTKDEFQNQARVLEGRPPVVAASQSRNATTDVDESSASTTRTKPSRQAPPMPSRAKSRSGALEEAKTEQDDSCDYSMAEMLGTQRDTTNSILHYEPATRDGDLAVTTRKSTTPASAWTSDKRRRDGDCDNDVDGEGVVVINATKRQRTANIFQNDTTQDSTQTTQTQTARDVASCRLKKVVGELVREETAAVDDTSWTVDVADALKISHDLTLNPLLVEMARALANKLVMLIEDDRDAVQSDTVEEILGVLDNFPRHDLYNVGDLFEHTEESIKAQWHAVEPSFAYVEELATRDIGKHEEQVADAIRKITEGLKAFIGQKKSILDSTVKAQNHLDCERDRKREVEKAIKPRPHQASRPASNAEQEMTIARDNSAAALMDAIKHPDNIQSTSSSLVELAQALERVHMQFVQAKTHQDVVQKLEALRQETVPRLVKWLDQSAARVREQTATDLVAVDEKIKLCVDNLSDAMGKYFKYHTDRQKFAAADVKKRQQEVNDDKMWNVKLGVETQDRIGICEGAIKDSTGKMREVVRHQWGLWNGTCSLLSQCVQDKVELMYGNLSETLTEEHSKSVRAEIADSLNKIRKQRATSLPSTAVATPTVEPEQFVGRDGDDSSTGEDEESQLAPGTSSWWKLFFGR
ncbi:hypothetical protein Gpo141_00013042 [Globisporangium polare]